MRYTCAIRAVATVGKLILIKSQRAIHWPAARSLSFSRSLPHRLSFSHSLHVQVLFAKSGRIFVSVSERGPCRAYSQQRSRCQWAKDATADCRLSTAVSCYDLAMPLNDTLIATKSPSLPLQLAVLPRLPRRALAK